MYHQILINPADIPKTVVITPIALSPNSLIPPKIGERNPSSINSRALLPIADVMTAAGPNFIHGLYQSWQNGSEENSNGYGRDR
ncbi:hypothetical protein NPIL_382291 [Nephila pilipes]|uniref:Uncharacterized protein n=1 Tax=Nephila pilipes TaxID=299642 RepID=A0A8X6UF22_NEPPI|nr:hypothetical protein NPIL_382291 [Nephila pilipes]